MKALKNFLTRNVGVLFLFILVVLFAYPYIFLNKTPFPADYQVNHFPPWSNIQEYWGPVKNGAMPDIIDQIYPWRHLSVESLAGGQLSFWNPNSFAGNPHLANFQSAALSPFNILFLVIPFIDAWTFLIVAQPLIAGISMYLLIRSFKKSKTASLLASIAFMFCGFIVVWMAYGTLSMAIAVLPLTLFAAKKVIDTGSLKFGFLLSLTLMFSFFSGHFQTSLYLFLYILSFVVFLLLERPKAKRFLLLIGFLTLGFAGSLIQIIPTVQFYLLSVRSYSFITGGGIPFDHLVTIIAPDFFGNPVTRNDWVGSYAEWAMFVGIVPLFFAIASLKKGSREVWYGLSMTIITLILAVSSPVQGILGGLHIPVLSTSNPTRIVVLLSFSLAFLSAFGFDSFYEYLKERRIKKLMFPFAVLSIIFAVIWIFLLTNPYSVEHLAVARRNLMLPTAIFAALFIATVVVYKFIKVKHILLSFSILVLVLASFDSLRFATKWMPVAPKDKVFVYLPVIEAMQKEIGHGRMFGNLGGQITTYYNIPGIEGYDPLYIGRYGEFVQAARLGAYEEPLRSVVRINRDAAHVDRLIDILGVAIIFHPIADTNQSWAYPVWDDLERFEEIYKDKNFQLFRNNTSVVRGTIYYDFEVIQDDRDVLKRFYSESFDFRNTLILEKDPGIGKSEEEGISQAEFIRDEPESIELKVKTDREGILFLSDNFYPGWHALVNGQEVEIYRANYSFRGVKVPAGESVVEFYYRFEI